MSLVIAEALWAFSRVCVGMHGLTYSLCHPVGDLYYCTDATVCIKTPAAHRTQIL